MHSTKENECLSLVLSPCASLSVSSLNCAHTTDLLGCGKGKAGLPRATMALPGHRDNWVEWKELSTNSQDLSTEF